MAEAICCIQHTKKKIQAEKIGAKMKRYLRMNAVLMYEFHYD